jgi:hypothetical protein
MRGTPLEMQYPASGWRCRHQLNLAYGTSQPSRRCYHGWREGFVWLGKAAEVIVCPHGNPKLRTTVVQLGLNNIPLASFFGIIWQFLGACFRLSRPPGLHLCPKLHPPAAEFPQPAPSRPPSSTSARGRRCGTCATSQKGTLRFQRFCCKRRT